MSNKILSSIIILISAAFLAFSFNANKGDDAKYVGVKTCGMCHKKDKDGNQLKVWENSAHAKAYETLKSDEANKISQKLYGKNAVDAKECMKCHVTGYGMDESMMGKRFKMEDGVQCETCHGPGSEYKSMKIMKNKDDAIKNGLRVWKDDKEIEKFCVTCHNSESPTFMEFDFQKMYSQIKHEIPK
jgi:cytochrome c553